MLNVVSFEEAKKIIKEKLFTVCTAETAELDFAAERIAAEDIESREDIPAFDRTTVDGWAVKAKDTYGAGESIPAMLDIRGEILMGENADFRILPGQCAKISTGGMLPEGADAVVMVENTDCENGELCLVFKAASPFENVTRRGDDAKKGEIIIPAGTLIRPRHIGVLAAAGYADVPVRKKITAGIISTGDEIVPVGAIPSCGQVRDVNSHLLRSLLNESGCEAVSLGVVRDDYGELYDAVKDASEKYDVVLISGGSSAGVRDMTAKIISELGEVYAHGIAMKPGKPTILGKAGNTPVFGLPGHPAAAFFVAKTLIGPALCEINGLGNTDRTVRLPLKSNVSSNHGRTEFLCVKEENGFALPAYAKSGIISMLSKTDGYIVIDRNSEGLRAGEEVEIHLF